MFCTNHYDQPTRFLFCPYSSSNLDKDFYFLPHRENVNICQVRDLYARWFVAQTIKIEIPKRQLVERYEVPQHSQQVGNFVFDEPSMDSSAIQWHRKSVDRTQDDGRAGISSPETPWKGGPVFAAIGTTNHNSVIVFLFAPQSTKVEARPRIACLRTGPIHQSMISLVDALSILWHGILDQFLVNYIFLIQFCTFYYLFWLSTEYFCTILFKHEHMFIIINQNYHISFQINK